MDFALFKSPMKDYGYDVSDYRQVDPMFGSLDDFDRLVEEAHRRGLRVLIDQVLSHTSDQHTWFTESRQSPGQSEVRLVCLGGRARGWLSAEQLAVGVRRGVMEWDPRRGQYYLHNFLVSQPDLNLHNPEVRQANLENLEFWLKRGVDGFRSMPSTFARMIENFATIRRSATARVSSWPPKAW